MEQFQSFKQDASTYKTVPVTYRSYTDTLTPIQIYERLREEAVYLLESGDHTSSWSRYSFIGLHPFIHVTEDQGSITMHDYDTGDIQQAKDLKEAVETVMTGLNVRLPDVPLPFHGGGVGFVSYDAVSDFENIPIPENDDLGLPLYQFLFCRTLIAYDHQSHDLHIIRFARVDEDDSEAVLNEKYDAAVSAIDDVLKTLKQQKNVEPFFTNEASKSVDVSQVETNYTKDKFKQDVETIKEYIRAGDIFQAVLSQRFSKQIEVDGFTLYRVLRQVNPSPYMFYLTFDGYEVIGSSPERLVQVKDGEVEIHPIAGTRKRGTTKEEDMQLAADLQNDEKEKAEHYMLVDLARNDVGRVAQYGTVKVPVLSEITRFSHVMHMISKVTGDLREDTHPLDAFVSAFPAGTLSGAPKIRAMEILGELEPTARNLYGGGVVYLGFDGNLDSCIAIRTILLKDQVAYIQAGAGVVADSDPEKEWQETVNKASALLQTIDMAEELFAPSAKEESSYA
ncbi:anthranilate synthase subunit I [Pontibacillus halophilus JSM 076056 = DSM 19796]|uniref:Anthranilate synthase component 1 n=1 Tax=Pontibacillus halophilus JSM 076056 = DSM 19796 TaxID=1385510 RepID=A0A0A5IDU4_9BACI|nr:anthranilate synthase component I [Pontibacillus halophilus]KGX93987.1 anthranilate synthase subunit I [Pontibacillus halophilus JSM 076056 = DSM 19796]